MLTVGQTARILGVSPSTLRLWETVGLVAPPRSRGRFRLYTPQLLERLKRIKYLRDVQHLNAHGIKRELNGNGKGDGGPVRASNDKRVMVPPTAATMPVGPRLRKLRERRGLSMAAVASQAGISIGFLSAFERNEANASFATLARLAAVYDTTLMKLFGGRTRRGRLVRPKERRVLRGVPGVRMEFLSSGGQLLESMLFRVAPQAGSEGAYSHSGEEFILILSGTLEIWLDETECYVLREGDSFWFESTLAHRWINPGRTEAILVWINTQPSF
jgi:DNA-binding transcriptional MerR regulator/quercetin dioxygenase-like cupin family protein